MVARYLIWASCALSMPPVAVTTSAAPTAELREWVDASGTKRAVAALIRVDDDTVWLRRADGRLAIASLAQLSARDRQYVATVTKQNRNAKDSAPTPSPKAPANVAEDSSLPEMVEAVTEEVAEAVETVQELPQRLAESQAAALRPVPAAIMYVRVSRAFLEEYVERNVNRRKPVRDCVLGVPISGQSHTRGRTQLTLLPSNRELAARIAFDGTVHSRTYGRKGPVVLHYASKSTFHTHKLIVLDDNGLRISPATGSIDTDLDLMSVGSSLPRLRGRIARRIGARRARQSHGRAQAITADHTLDDVRSDFDARVDQSMTKLQRVLGSKIPDLDTGTTAMPTDVRFRCRLDTLEMALLREDATLEEHKLRPPMPVGNPDLALRVHRTMFTSAIADPQLMQDLTPLFTRLLDARSKQQHGAASQPAADHGAKWSMDLEWVSLDFTDTTR